MIACIERDEDHYGSRLAYYNTIINYSETSGLQDFDLQLQALVSLTTTGRNVDDFFLASSKLPVLLIAWTQMLNAETQLVRVGNKSDILFTWGTSVESMFHSFLQFLVRLFSEHHVLFSNPEISTLVFETVNICGTTPSENDIEHCLNFLHAVICHSFLPAPTLSPLLDMLCSVSVLPQRAEQAWSLVEELSKSYISNNTFVTLCEILQNASADSNSSTIIGATIYVERLVTLYVEDSRQAEISILKVMNAYRLSLTIDVMKHHYQVCSSIYNLLSNRETRKLFTYDVWDSFEFSPFETLYLVGQSPNIKQAMTSHRSCGLDGSAISEVEPKNYSPGNIIQKFYDIFALCSELCVQDQSFLGSKEMIIDFLVDMSHFLKEDSAILVIEHFKKFHYCNPLAQNWLKNTDELLRRFFRNGSWDTRVRQKVLEVMEDSFYIATEVSDSSEISTLADKVFHNVENEPDFAVLNSLISLFVKVARDCSHIVLCHISEKFLTFFSDNGPEKNATLHAHHGTSIEANSSFPQTTGSYSTQTFRKKLVVTAFCKIFFGTLHVSAQKAKSAYNSLYQICQLSKNDPVSYIEAARVLCRLRASADNYIYVSTPTNMDGLAASVGRNLIGVPDISKYQESMIWWYPEKLEYIEDAELEVVSYVLKRRTITEDLSEESEDEIDISLWFNEMLRVIEYGGVWEIYSFVWAHFGPQLANIQLFYPSGCDIQRLRHIICDQILNSSASPDVTFPPDVSRNDIKVTLIRTTSSLLSYHDIFTKREEDFIVRAFVDGINTSEKAVVPCIHGLVVSCYELPLSIKKYLGQIFTKFQTKITNSATSPHILEFLLSLSRLPSLTDNFTQDEYKRVFGMAIKYIQYAYQLAQQEQKNIQSPEQRANNSARPGAGTIQNTIDSSNNKVLSQYLLVLAYNVIATWFLTLRLPDRKYIAKFIIRNLILAEGTSDTIDTQSLAYVDLISRFTYSNLDLTVQSTMNTQPANGTTVTKQWIYGSSIISISTVPQTGDSQITVRRPTGTSVFDLKLDSSMVPGWMGEMLSEFRGNEDNTEITQRLKNEADETVSPSHFLLQLVPNDVQPGTKPLQIPNDPATSRAIGAFDRTPVVDFHKVGVMYIAPGQHEELEILSNSVGSVHYQRFLQRMGQLVKLRDNRKIYTGGLDITNDIDGEYAYVWSDKVTQLIFHTTTMMPPPANPHDTSFASKKRHIGNDFVNIFFDESEVPFEFGLVKSQFNFVNISITPISVTFSRSGGLVVTEPVSYAKSPMTDPSTPPHSAGGNKMFYKVRALCKPGVPAIFAACHLKIVSEDSLSRFVRNLAIIASKFATVWNSQGGYISHWQYRLDQINTLRDKVIADMDKASSTDSNTKGNSSAQVTQVQNKDDKVEKKEEIAQSFLDQLSGSVADISEKQEQNAPTFSMDKPDGKDDEIPLLKTLDFSSFA